MKTSRAKTLAALAIIAALAAGCSEPKEPMRITAEIPSGGKELEAWTTKVAEDNNIKTAYGAAGIARTICSEMLPKHSDLTKVRDELAGFRGVELRS